MKKVEFKMPSMKILEKLPALRKPKAQPVFNRPVCTEREYRVNRIFHIVLLSLMVGVSMAIVGLKATTLIFIEDNNNKGFQFESGDPEPTILAALPRNLYTAPGKLAMVAGVYALCMGIAHVVFVIVDWKSGKKVYNNYSTTIIEIHRTDSFRRNLTLSAEMLCSFISATPSLFSLH